MPTVANIVVVQNRTSRAYFIGDVEVLAGGWGRVDADHPFLAELISRGSFQMYPEPPVEEVPVVETTKKTSTKTSSTSKGDEA